VRFLLSSFGSAGDVRPLLSVGSALSKAGHETVCVLDPSWCRVAEIEYGLSAIPYGKPWDPATLANHPEWLDSKTGSVRMLTDLVIPRTPELVRAARRVAADLRPDAIIGHHISFGLPWVAEELGVPWIMCASAPSSWPSIVDPNLYPGMPDRNRYPKWTIKLGTSAAAKLINRTIDPAVNAVRRDLGLKPQKQTMLRRQFSDTLNLGLWSEHFRGPAADDPRLSRIVGFPGRPPSVGLDQPSLQEAIERSRERGERLAAWSLGTTAVHAGSAHRDRFIEVSRAAGFTPIVLTGNNSVAEQLSQSEGVIAAAYARHDTLFPLVDLVVHHAGIGTSAAVLKAGIPSVAIPFTHDQPDNARRLRRLALAAVIRQRSRDSDRFSGALSAAMSAADSPDIRSNAVQFARRLETDAFPKAVVDAVISAIR
jgi:rhamnosyltransferase subunit B